MLQRAAHHRANQVAPIVGVGLMVHQRVDRAGGGLGGGAKHGVARRFSVERGFSF
jgi:hypothetical protein